MTNSPQEPFGAELSGAPASAASAGAAPKADGGGNAFAQLSYEQAREQLIAVVGQLEAGSVSLEESLALWERGEALARRCEEWLDGAKKRLEAARSPQ